MFGTPNLIQIDFGGIHTKVPVLFFTRRGLFDHFFLIFMPNYGAKMISLLMFTMYSFVNGHFRYLSPLAALALD